MASTIPVLLVELSPEDVVLAEQIAANRNNPKEAHGVQSKKILPGSEIGIHIEGVKAEVAVARAFGVKPDQATSLHGDNGYDLKIRDFSCEVKCRSDVGWDFVLMNPNPDLFKADYGILVYKLSDTHYLIRGVICNEELKSLGHVANYGHGDRWIVEAQDMIHPLAFWYQFRK